MQEALAAIIRSSNCRAARSACTGVTTHLCNGIGCDGCCLLDIESFLNLSSCPAATLPQQQSGGRICCPALPRGAGPPCPASCAGRQAGLEAGQRAAALHREPHPLLDAKDACRYTHEWLWRALWEVSANVKSLMRRSGSALRCKASICWELHGGNSASTGQERVPCSVISLGSKGRMGLCQCRCQ